MNHTRNLAAIAVLIIGAFLFGYLGPKLVSAADTTQVIGGFLILGAFLYGVITWGYNSISKRFNKETTTK